MAVARPASTGQSSTSSSLTAFAWCWLRVLHQRLLRAVRREPLQLRNCRLFYRFAAVWGAHEGSLLWALDAVDLDVSRSVAFGRRLPETFRRRVLGVLGLVSTDSAVHAADLEPVRTIDSRGGDGATSIQCCRTLALAIHPPMLYTGYVGFSVAFAFAIAAMLERRPRPERGRAGRGRGRWSPGCS